MNRGFASSIIFAVLTIVFCRSRLQAGIDKPRTMVTNQPFLPAVIIEGNIPVMNSDFSTGDMVYSNSVNQSRLKVETAYPLVSSPMFSLLLGAGYIQNVFISTSNTVFQEAARGLYANVIGTGGIGDHWFWLSVHNFGYYTMDFGKSGPEALKYYQVTSAGYQWNDYFSTYLGFLFDTKFGDYSIMPVAGIAYSIGNWVLDILLPARMNVYYLVNPNFNILLTGGILPETYQNNDNRSKSYIEIVKPEAALKIETRLWKWMWLQCGLAYCFATILMEHQNQTCEKLGSLSPEFHINLAFIIRPE